MIKHTLRRGVLIGALATLALTAAACGSDTGTSSSGAAAASTTDPKAPTAVISSLSGVGTTVDLNPATVAVLTQNGVSVAPVAPATAASTNGQVAVTFPITGGNVSLYPTYVLPFIRGSVTHSGGVTFSAGGKSLTATNFIVDPGASTLTATVGGMQVKLLDLNGSGVQVSKDAVGHVLLDGTIAVLSSDAAAALNSTFGVTLFKQGIPLGVVHIVAAG